MLNVKTTEMTDIQENKMSMYIAVSSVMDGFNAVWAGTPAYVTAAGAYNGKLDEIRATRLVQEGDTTGVAADKAQAREAAVAGAIMIAAAVQAYASVEGNNTLGGLVDYSASDLRRSRDTVLSDRLDVIHDAANDNLAALTDYGVVGADLTAFEALIAAYNDQVQDPRTAIGGRAAATAHLVDLFTETDDILKNRLDNLTELYRATGPEFYAKYGNARKIIDLGRRSSGEPPVV